MALHHAKPGEIVELAPMGREIENARSSAIIKTDQFEAMRLVVRAGEEIPQHEVAGDITLHCLEGRAELRLGTSSVQLKANQWVYLDGGAPHSIKAIENSSLLLTIFLGGPARR
jgi:quercetin dioxygenase-like cupin family protein